ncbi:MAG: tetratricopeptide repeat protein [Segetibacter sp.]
MLTKEDITNVFLKLMLRQPLQENANMRLAADLYESLRPQINILDPSNVWDYIIIDKAKFDSDESVQLLVVLREVFFKTYIKKQLALLDEAISNKPNEVLDLWIQFYSDAAVNFREDFICILYHQRLKWDKDLEGIKKYLTLTRLMQEKRWADTYPFYEEIAGNSKLDKKTRVLAEVILAEIILYHYPQVTGAQKHLENADKLLENTDKLFSDYFITKKGWAEYYLKTGDPQKARNGFLEVITKQPGDFLAFNYVGDCFAAEGSLEYAESWYSDALQRNFLQTDTYKRLINLYADKKWFSEKQSQINNLLEKIKKRSWLFNMTKFLEKNVASQECFKDSGLYDSYRDIGSAWFANEDLEKAEEWYLKAVELQPTFTSAIVDIAYLKLHKQDPNKVQRIFFKSA